MGAADEGGREWSPSAAEPLLYINCGGHEGLPLTLTLTLTLTRCASLHADYHDPTSNYNARLGYGTDQARASSSRVVPVLPL